MTVAQISGGNVEDLTKVQTTDTGKDTSIKPYSGWESAALRFGSEVCAVSITG